MNKWIYDTDFENDIYICPECDFNLILYDGDPELNDFNYCPKCGKKLIEPGVENEIR
jgi:hypothetical protein